MRSPSPPALRRCFYKAPTYFVLRALQLSKRHLSLIYRRCFYNATFTLSALPFEAQPLHYYIS